MDSLSLLLTSIVGLVAGYVGLFLFLLPHIFLHEAGHFVAGYFCGLRLLRFRVGPMELGRSGLYKTASPLKLSWHWRWKYVWSGAIAMQASPGTMNGVRGRFAVYTAGGVVANLGCALLALPFAMQDSVVGGFCKYVVLLAAGFGIANLIPFRSRSLGFDSDGKRLIGLLRNSDACAVQMYWLTLSARLECIEQDWKSGQAKEAHQKIEALAQEGESLQLPEAMRPHIQGLRDLAAKINAGVAARTGNDGG